MPKSLTKILLMFPSLYTEEFETIPNPTSMDLGISVEINERNSPQDSKDYVHVDHAYTQLIFTAVVPDPNHNLTS